MLFLETFVNTCHCNLLQPTSMLPLAYLVSRGVTLQEIKQYKIGYMGSFIPNIPPDSLDAELFNKWLGTRGKFVTNRIVFPIYNELGELKGIETRSLDQRSMDILDPKYKKSLAKAIENLPESSVRYKKFYLQKEKFSPFFFGLPKSLESIWEKKEVFLTEGIFDALSLLKIYPNCISPLTANINEYQIDWLRRYSKKVYLMFDGDKKGKEATEKILKKLGDELYVYSIGIVSKNNIKDLNEYVVTNGLKDLKIHLDEKMKTFF